MVALEQVSLCCPHSGIKITEPVIIDAPGCDLVYDKQSVCEAIQG